MTPQPDILIIGSGMGGATLAAGLAPSGKRSGRRVRILRTANIGRSVRKMRNLRLAFNAPTR